MQWSTFRSQVRTSILNDTGATRRWSDDELLLYLQWALNALCEHTAMATATSFTADGETSAFPVPDNYFEPIDQSGSVYVDDGTTKTYMNPVKITQLQRVETGYYLMPETQVNLVDMPGTDDTVLIYYFSYYPIPSGDSDTLSFPQWAQKAISYHMAADAMTKYATKYASINQWNTNQNKGNPEDSSMGERALRYMEIWNEELMKRPAQRRENFFREV